MPSHQGVQAFWGDCKGTDSELAVEGEQEHYSGLSATLGAGTWHPSNHVLGLPTQC